MFCLKDFIVRYSQPSSQNFWELLGIKAKRARMVLEIEHRNSKGWGFQNPGNAKTIQALNRRKMYFHKYCFSKGESLQISRLIGVKKSQQPGNYQYLLRFGKLFLITDVLEIWPLTEICFFNRAHCLRSTPSIRSGYFGVI